MIIRRAEQFPKNVMRDKYLGECLDSIRWGALDNVAYETPPRELAKFVQEWMKQSEGSYKWTREEERQWYVLEFYARKRGVVPLERVFRSLDLKLHFPLSFPFDGWVLAEYVRGWYEQGPAGKVPFFESEVRRNKQK